MHVDKLVYLVIILGAFILTGCASTNKILELSSEINTLNKKVDQIEDNINVLKPELDCVKNEAIRANKRLDNQSLFYRK